MFLRSRRFGIYIGLGGLKGFEICRFLNFGQPVNRFLDGFRPNRVDQRVPEVEAVRLMYKMSLYGDFGKSVYFRLMP